MDYKNKSVLDVGTDTGILAVMAAKLGSTSIHAFDIDEWSVENSIENFDLNQTSFITINQGTIADQEVKSYDIVLANINRNILLAEIPTYEKFMAKAGILIVSGFYVTDVEDIVAAAEAVGLKKQTQISKNNWAAVVFIKG